MNQQPEPKPCTAYKFHKWNLIGKMVTKNRKNYAVESCVCGEERLVPILENKVGTPNPPKEPNGPKPLGK